MSPDPGDGELRNPIRAGAPKPRADKSTFHPNPGGKGAGASRPPSKSTGGTFDPLGGSSQRIAEGPRWWERILFGRVSSGQLAQFCRQFAAYLNAGVDITRSLSSLEKQFGGTALAPVLARVQLSVRKGSTLEEAMGREPQVFGSMFLSMMRVAEMRGGVPETLKMLAQHFESRQRLIRQARSAMIYPVIVLVIASCVVALVSVFLLPLFATILKDIAGRAQLPFASRALMAFSGFIQMGGWWLFPIVLVVAPIALFKFYGTAMGKSLLDRMVLLTPVFGPLCRKLDTSRFTRTLSVLLEAGVDVGASLDLTAEVLVMTPIRNSIRQARSKIMAGRELSTILSDSNQFYGDVLAVVRSGEETGKLPESLLHLADDYDEQVSLMVKNLGQLVQPMVIVLLGLIVLFIILAVFLPIIQLITTLASPGG